MKRFNEKLVVLSGAAAGIGYSTALRLADEGANLIVIDYDANGIKALKKKLTSSIFETYVHDICFFDLFFAFLCFGASGVNILRSITRAIVAQ